MVSSAAEEKIPPLFLVGCSRSGTTLLASLLEARFDIAAPLETHFIPYYTRLLWLWGDLSLRQNRERLVEELSIFLEIWTARNNPMRALSEYYDASLLAVVGQREEIVADTDSFAAIATRLFDLYAVKHDRTNWADFSSFYDVEPIADWGARFPDMRVIHIVRDGRDVALSWLKSWFRPSNLADAAERWAEHVAEKRHWGKEHPERYLEIRYEDLLHSPERVTEAIAEFIGLVPAPGPLDLQKGPAARVLSVGGTHDLLTGGIASANRDKWKREWSVRQQRFFEYLAGGQLEASRYLRVHTDITPSERLLFATWKWLSRPWRYFLAAFYLRKAKSILPLAIFILRRLGVPPGTIAGWLR